MACVTARIGIWISRYWRRSFPPPETSDHPSYSRIESIDRIDIRYPMFAGRPFRQHTQGSSIIRYERFAVGSDPQYPYCHLLDSARIKSDRSCCTPGVALDEEMVRLQIHCLDTTHFALPESTHTRSTQCRPRKQISSSPQTTGVAIQTVSRWQVSDLLSYYLTRV